MKRFLISSIVFSILFLTACLSPSGGVSTPTATGAPSETSSPTPTETPTPSPSPQSLLPPEVQEKFNQAGIDLKDMQNAEYDKDGLHITLPSGEVIVLTNDQLQKGMYNGQDNVLQYRDEANQNVIYAFDLESKTFLEASKYIQKDKTDPEKYIQVANWDELKALWAKEKMFLIPFDPQNTYFPLSEEIFRDYGNRNNIDLDKPFNYKYPFGELPEGMDSPFKFVNFVKMPRDPQVIGSVDAFIISEQVFNPDDGSFSVLHFYQVVGNNGLQIIQEQVFDNKFFLPKFKIEENKLIPEIKELVYRWFNERHVPKELENIILYRFSPSLITGENSY